MSANFLDVVLCDPLVTERRVTSGGYGTLRLGGLALSFASVEAARHVEAALHALVVEMDAKREQVA